MPKCRTSSAHLWSDLHRLSSSLDEFLHVVCSWLHIQGQTRRKSDWERNSWSFVKKIRQWLDAHVLPDLENFQHSLTNSTSSRSCSQFSGNCHRMTKMRFEFFASNLLSILPAISLKKKTESTHSDLFSMQARISHGRCASVLPKTLQSLLRLLEKTSLITISSKPSTSF